MTTYRIAEPRECFRCGGLCYARDWWYTSTTGTPYAKGVAKVRWQCAQCGRRFDTMEHLEEVAEEANDNEEQ